MYVILLDNVSDNFIDLEENSSNQEDLPEENTSDQEVFPEENSSDQEVLPEDNTSDQDDFSEENSSDQEVLPEDNTSDQDDFSEENISDQEFFSADNSSDQDLNETNNYFYSVSYNSVSDNFVTFEHVALFDTTLIFLLACCLGALVFNAFMKKL